MLQKHKIDNENIETQTSLKLTFFRYVFALIAISIILGSIILLMDRNSIIEKKSAEAKIQLEYQKNHLLDYFNNIKSDLLFLTQLNELQRHMELNKEEDRLWIENEFLEFSKYKNEYDQIRYIDENGYEIIRINYDYGKPYAVTKDNLQNKKDRYYFIDSMAIPTGEIYYSPFDLNIENGAIEVPLKPMIRFGTPIYNKSQENKGIIILNFLGMNLLINLLKATNAENGNFSLLNKDGFWIFNDNPEDEWGFMYPERQENNMMIRNLEVWDKIKDSQYSQNIVGESVLTSVRVSPFLETESDLDIYWIMTNTIPFDEIGISWGHVFFRIRYIALLVLLIDLVLAYLLSVVITQKNVMRLKMEHSALFDSLTGLANRRFLYERIENAIAQSQRYKYEFALIYVDLDGFKAVNDSLGHNAGDQLLKTVGSRLRDSVRSTDIVSRMGGDEFVILISQIKERDNCITIAEKILKNLSLDYILKQGKVNVQGSIGIVISDPDKNETTEELLKYSDAAMYQVKKSGKNNYHISDKS